MDPDGGEILNTFTLTGAPALELIRTLLGGPLNPNVTVRMAGPADIQPPQDDDLSDMPGLEPIPAQHIPRAQQQQQDEAQAPPPAGPPTAGANVDDDMPPLEPLSTVDAEMAGFAQRRRAREANQDERMSTDSMPSLQSVSDSSEEESDEDDYYDDDDDEQDEAEMMDLLRPVADDGDPEWEDDDTEGMPGLEAIEPGAPRRTSARRTRAQVEDAEASDPRPTQRQRVEIEEVQDPEAPRPRARSAPRPQPHPHPHPGRFAGAPGFAIRLDVRATGPLGDLPPEALGADGRPRWGIFGMGPNGITLPMDGVGITPNILELITTLGRQPLFMQPEKDDPERAQRLVDGLEVVPTGLVRRMERVGAPGGHMDDANASAEDDAPGCAICWDRLLDPEGEGFQAPMAAGEAPAPTPTSGDDSSAEATSSTADAASSSTSAPTPSDAEYPKIVSLPCAHVFHASCLIPWFSRPRQTTCPTCRFNVDPENLTYRPPPPPEPRQREATNGDAPAPEANVAAPAAAAPGVDAGVQADPAVPAASAPGVDAGVQADAPENPAPEAVQNTPDAPAPPDNGTRILVDMLEAAMPTADMIRAMGMQPLDPVATMALLRELAQVTAQFPPLPGVDVPRRAAGPRKEWQLPPAPGPTVRQRVEARERELGLRCADPVCGLGPSDEEPAGGPRARRDLGIRGAGACVHTFHPACLVTAERVFGCKEGAGEDVDVNCPTCRAVGTVSRAEWDEGVAALA